MSVVALVIAPSIAMDNVEVTAYIESKLNDSQTIESVVEGNEIKEMVKVIRVNSSRKKE
jgi:hypothetical protein